MATKSEDLVPKFYQIDRERL
ncbi:uncharacterized protein G2W53_013659 [Senna tora]|uniref:Uncharacterized protein n=1 Tax=Senna tora TaxID=362788 RepID=A0A834U2N3_9FABA|nr:uncharacterized protein G2W53_013659 [Senna tora]